MESKIFSDKARLARITNTQRAALEKIAMDLDKKFLSGEKIKARILSGKTKGKPDEIDITSGLDLIDAVRENFRTALQFDDFRRAARYLATLEMLCKKFLT